MGDFAGIPHKLEPSLELFLRQREHLHQVEKVFKATKINLNGNRFLIGREK